MGIKYENADDIMKKLFDITRVLGMEHVKLSGVYAIRSRGSGSRGTIGRCHALGKIWQHAMGMNAAYIIEIISERFDRMSFEDQDRVLVHELMHIPLSFGGGFKHHDFVTNKNVEKLYQKYRELKDLNINNSFNPNLVKKEIQKHEKEKKEDNSSWF
jgi:predicted metallopeptidase